MKICLDLLPQDRKQEIKRKKLFREILSEQLLFLLPIVVFIFILLNIYYVLTLQRKSSVTVHSTELSQDKYKQLSIYENKFKEANAQDQLLTKIQAGHLYWQKLFKELSDITSDNVYITDLSTKNYSVYLIGKAKTRDDLLDFKGKLDSSDCFNEVNMPLSNLVTKDNVDFQLDFKITQDCLRQK